MLVLQFCLTRSIKDCSLLWVGGLFILLNNLFFMLFVWVCLFLITLLHEMGHALMFRIFFRDKDWHITIGTGRTIISIGKFTIRAFPLTGFCEIAPKYKGSKFQYIMFFLGGPLTNLLFIILLSFMFKITKINELGFEQPNLVWILAFVFWANISQLVSTIIPLKIGFWPFKGYISDGMRIVKKAKETNMG